MFGQGVIMFRDHECKNVYFMAAKEDMVLQAGEMVGGIGGGNIIDSDDSKSKAVPWTLPLGDRTWVQLAKDKDKDKDNDEGDDARKFWSGTLYACIRGLEAKSTKPITMTSFGEASPVTENGNQCYAFKNPEDAENHRAMDYVLTASKPNAKVTAQNLFSPLVDRTSGLGKGVLRPTWRLAFDTVAHTLKPTKVHVTTAERIVLPKGQPVKVAWNSE
jgi:hypothetical protein